MNIKDRIGFWGICLIAIIVILPLGIVVLNKYKGNIQMESYTFTESSRELQNPERGFYNLYRFMITDEKENYWRLVSELYKTDVDTTLTLVEINLQNYRDSEITDEGMNNIEFLFQALADIDKQLIVRFVYDWDGENEKYEPETIDIILEHMRQMKGVLNEFGENIFIVQGLFIGNWGEMNGTKYFSDADFSQLIMTMDEVTHQSIYLAVRTPSYWRRITGLENISKDSVEADPLARRISLYNDGMLGNESDYGTYRVVEADGKKNSEREEELDFQNELCCWVPNGGEVIDDNYYNDFENAIEDLATMHVTYLNEGHDQAVLDKWKNTVVTQKGCFEGMDGYTYIKRHLGYRLFITKANFHYNTFKNELGVRVTMKNVGFAPVYTNPYVDLVLYDEEHDTYLRYTMEGNLCELAGGNRSEETLTLEADITTDKLLDTRYEVYISIIDSDTGNQILLANEQDVEESGYHIGSIELYK